MVNSWKMFGKKFLSFKVDPIPLIHQGAELPKIEPFVDEYRLHRLNLSRPRPDDLRDFAIGRPHRWLRA